MRQILSNYVLVENPFYTKDEKSVIHLSDADKEEMVNDRIEKCKSLDVVQVGLKCETVKQGDKILPDIDRLMASKRIVLEDKGYFVMRETDIILVY